MGRNTHDGMATPFSQYHLLVISVFKKQYPQRTVALVGLNEHATTTRKGFKKAPPSNPPVACCFMRTSSFILQLFELSGTVGISDPSECEVLCPKTCDRRWPKH